MEKLGAKYEQVKASYETKVAKFNENRKKADEAVHELITAYETQKITFEKLAFKKATDPNAGVVMNVVDLVGKFFDTHMNIQANCMAIIISFKDKEIGVETKNWRQEFFALGGTNVYERALRLTQEALVKHSLDPEVIWNPIISDVGITNEPALGYVSLLPAAAITPRGGKREVTSVVWVFGYDSFRKYVYGTLRESVIAKVTSIAPDKIRTHFDNMYKKDATTLATHLNSTLRYQTGPTEEMNNIVGITQPHQLHPLTTNGPLLRNLNDPAFSMFRH